MKKKILLGAIVLLVVICTVVFLLGKGGKTSDVERIISITSGVYTEAQITDAMEVVENHFRKNFDDCSLLRLEYDEGKTLSERYHLSEDYGVERVIVLESDYYVGDHAEGCFTPDYTYKNWKWILTDEGDGWVLRTSGYG